MFIYFSTERTEIDRRRIHLLQKIAFPIKYLAELCTKIIYNTNIQAKKSTIEQNFGGVEELGYVLIHFLFLDGGVAHHSHLPHPHILSVLLIEFRDRRWDNSQP